MDFDFSADQYGMRDEARRFLEEQCTSATVRACIDEPAAFSRDLWKQMASLGWMGLAFPIEYGGLGQSFLDLVLLLEELGRALAPVPFLSSVALAGQTILRHGSDEQRRQWLPAIASGECIAALAIAEEPGSFDPSGVRAIAEHSTGACRVTGRKRFVIDAPVADLFVVAARGPDGTRWFVVESDAADVTTEQPFDRTRSIGSLRLDGARAEPLAVAGIETGMHFATAALCAEMVGVGQKILDMSVSYAGAREQFGRPIGSFQAIKHKCAEMATELEAARSAAYYASWAVETKADDAEIAVSIAKSYGSDALGHLAAEGVQIHGGIAFTWEHDMHLYLKRIKSSQPLLGDAPYHREQIARMAGL